MAPTTYENYYTAALDSLGLTYGVWDLAAGKLNDEVLQAYSLLIWQVGLAYPTLDAEDRDFLSQHLDHGGKLFLTGQDIGWELADPSSSVDPVWYHDYLHASYVTDDTNIYYLDGVAGDPITDGLDPPHPGRRRRQQPGVPGRDRTLRQRRDGDPQLPEQQLQGAIRATDSTSGARIVYLGFGYEAVDNPQDRAALLGAALDWLGVDELFVDGFDSGDTSRWSVTVP